MDDVFDFRNRLIGEYSSFSRSFSKVAAPDILVKVEEEYARGRYWPEPLIQINPNYKRSGTVQQLAKDGVLHPDCAHIFQAGKTEGKSAELHLYVHQLQALARHRTSKVSSSPLARAAANRCRFSSPLLTASSKPRRPILRSAPGRSWFIR